MAADDGGGIVSGFIGGRTAEDDHAIGLFHIGVDFGEDGDVALEGDVAVDVDVGGVDVAVEVGMAVDRQSGFNFGAVLVFSGRYIIKV